MIGDLRYACRVLWRGKTFTAAASLTLALGIAGITVVFALIQGVLLRPLPVLEQDRLIVAWKEARTSGSARYPFGNSEIEAVADVSRLLESAAGVTRNGVSRSVLSDAGVSSYANVALVTGGFFDVLGVEPHLGRSLSRADDREGAEPVVVISSGLWHRRFGAIREIIGRHITLGERPFTIVGVMPPDLDFPSGVEVWRLTISVPSNGPFGDAARREVNLIGRLRPGVSLEQATTEIVSLSQRVDAETAAMRGLTPIVRPFLETVIGDVRRTMLALFVAVALVLLIATANVANLLLTKGEARRGEFAVRTALGAGRGRIVRQVLAESLLLSLIAGVVGSAVAWWGLPVLVTLVPDGLPRVEAIRIDRSVIAFSILALSATAALAGLIPGLLSVRTDVVSPLRGGASPTTVGAVSRGRRSLVVAQIALAVTVLAAAGVLVRTVLNLQSIDLGLTVERLVLLDLHLPSAKYGPRDARARFLDEAIAAFEAVPAIAGATPVNIAPFADRGWDVPRVSAEGQSDDETMANPSLNLESVHPNYFSTVEVPIVRGRGFTTSDRSGAVPVAMVSEDVASRLWPRQDPIGKRLKMGSPQSKGGWLEVVGVAGETRYRTLTSVRPTLYLPAAQFQMTAAMLIVRTEASLELLTSTARARLGEIDPDVQLMRVAPFAELLDRPLARPRFAALVLGVFAVVALMLAAVGLYAVMAAHVRQREREIALRFALGATPRGVRHLLLSEALKLAGSGAVIGVGGAIAAARGLRGMVFGIDAIDPVSLIASAAALVAVAALASLGPLRRATRTDVSTMLRS